MSRDEWIKRCAAEYMRLGGLDEDSALDIARATRQVAEKDGTLDDGPEEAANVDIECWEP